MPPETGAMLELDLRHALQDFELRVRTALPLDGVTGLFGPSGSGKSTLLRIIAGFEAATGSVRLGGGVWADSEAGVFLPPHRRAAGYVFQDARLFPHLDVAGNLGYARRRAAAGGPGWDEVVAALELGPLLARGVERLSGGETQRVALARTLLSGTELLLLDEPLASLDTGRKAEILPYLESLVARFGIPVVYVSHAVDEIVRLADRVIVLEAGRVRAAGSTVRVFNELAAPIAAPVFDTPSVLEARVLRQLPELHLTELDCHGQTLTVPQLAGRKRGETLRLRVRAGDVALATLRPSKLSFRNVLAGRLETVTELADSAFAIAVVDVGGTRLRSSVTRQAVAELGLEPGMEIFALLKTAAFDARDGEAAAD